MRNRVAVASASLVVLVLAGGRAQAQDGIGLELDRYTASQTVADGFAIDRPEGLGHLQVDVQIHFDYALNPLVYETDLGNTDTETSALVEHQLAAQLGVAIGLVDRLVLFAGLPATLVMEGDNEIAGMPTIGGSAVGDPRFGARGVLVGDADSSFALALQLAGTAPLAHAVDEEEPYQGREGFGFRPQLLAEVRTSSFRLALDLGARLQKEASLDTLTVGQELTFGLGGAVPIGDDVTAMLEVFGSTDLDRLGDRENTPLEALAGAKFDCGHGWIAGAAAGTGLSRGYGTPDFWAVLTLGHTTRYEREPPPPPPPPADTDGDGMNDEVDGCPEEAEDFDEFEDENGCPDTDNDGDEVLDAADGAPNDPEDRDSFEDEDGVPDPDNDGDGLLDGSDRCPTEAEDVDQIQDADGCPEQDADSDTVPDPDDHCPLTPGLAAHSNPECIGCPALACTDPRGSIRILQRIEFETDRDVLRPESDPVLQAVREILATNDQIRKLRVEGHTDDRGNDAHNLDLSRRRATSVMRWLVEHGIAAERLESEGYGETRPLVPNRGAGRQTNRRVEFRITDPAPPAEAATPGPDAAPGAAPAPAPAPDAPAAPAPAPAAAPGAAPAPAPPANP